MSDVSPDLVTGGDGLPRCPWAYAAPEYLQYHDTEWGRPVRDDDGMFERLVLEGFQSGLSWLTILRRREAFRDAFAGFSIDRVAAFDTADVARLLADRRIIRNRAKIEAAIVNARAALRLRAAGVSLAEFIWRFAPVHSPARRRISDIPAQTPESRALARELRAHGFRFVGAVTAYAHMQATGMVDDHLVGCVAGASGHRGPDN